MTQRDRIEHVGTEVAALQRRLDRRIPIRARLGDGSILTDFWFGNAIHTDDIECFVADVRMYYNQKVVEFEIGKPRPGDRL